MVTPPAGISVHRARRAIRVPFMGAGRQSRATGSISWQGVSASEPAASVDHSRLKLVDEAPAAGPAADAPHATTKPPPAAVSDWSELMARAQDGDRAAYRRLLTEITPYLRGLAARRLIGPTGIEDAVQDVLLTIHEVRHTYDPARPFGPWLATIAKRRIIDRFRQEARRRTRETPLKPAHETFAVDPSNRSEESADRYALRRAVDGLVAGQRLAIRLLKLQEMSLKEASMVSGMSISALKVATHRAVKNLRRNFVGENDWP